jgi:hypothetical protein
VDLFYWFSGFLVIILLIASWGLFGFMVWKAIRSQFFQWEHLWWGLVAAGALFLTGFYHFYWYDLGLNSVLVAMSLIVIPLGTLGLLGSRQLFAVAFAIPTLVAGMKSLAYEEDISRFLPNPVTDTLVRHMLRSEGIRFPSDARRFQTSMIHTFGGEHYRSITFVSDQLDEFIHPTDLGYLIDPSVANSRYRKNCVFQDSDWFQAGHKVYVMNGGALPDRFKSWESGSAVVQKLPGQPSRAEICLIEL